MEEETEFAASQINWNEIEFKSDPWLSRKVFIGLPLSSHSCSPPLWHPDSWLLLQVQVDADGCLFIVSAVV